MKTQIVIEVKKGIVQQVASNQDIEYVLLDWDNIQEGEEFPTENHASNQDRKFEDLGEYLKFMKP